jgi:hypothetical protein
MKNNRSGRPAWRGLLLPLLLLAPAVALAQPRLHIVGGGTHDWGRVPPGIVGCEFAIVNTGTDTLRVSLRPTCGCTLAPLDRSALGPGDTAIARVTVDLIGYAAEQQKRVEVVSNDPEHPTSSLTLKAFVLHDLVASRVIMGWDGDVEVGREVTTSVEITNVGERVVRIDPPEPLADDAMTVRFEQRKGELAPGEKLTLTAHVTPRREGTLHHAVVIHTSAPYNGSLRFLLFGTVGGEKGER